MTHPLVQSAGGWMRDVLPDAEVVTRVSAGETELFELLVRRHNQRLFRTVRSVVPDDGLAEEALQLAWVAAWRHLATFAGRAKFVTWMTRIAIRKAREVMRDERRANRVIEARPSDSLDRRSPGSEIERRELAAMLERLIDTLPETYRVVFVMRAVEGLSTAEVAEALGLDQSAVKVRLFRARGRLKNDLLQRSEAIGVYAETWAFAGERCDRIVAAVLGQILRVASPGGG